MKRHPSLIPLSRQHHRALLLAQMLKLSAPDYIGMPTDASGKTLHALTFFASDLLPHFEAEEKIFNMLRNIDPELDIALEQILAEHELLRDLFQSLPRHAADVVYLDSIGQMLENHIRREDRELFPMIERKAPEEVMTTIASILCH